MSFHQAVSWSHWPEAPRMHLQPWELLKWQNIILSNGSGSKLAVTVILDLGEQEENRNGMNLKSYSQINTFMWVLSVKEV